MGWKMGVSWVLYTRWIMGRARLWLWNVDLVQHCHDLRVKGSFQFPAVGINIARMVPGPSTMLCLEHPCFHS